MINSINEEYVWKAGYDEESEYISPPQNSGDMIGIIEFADVYRIIFLLLPGPSVPLGLPRHSPGEPFQNAPVDVQ